MCPWLHAKASEVDSRQRTKHKIQIMVQESDSICVVAKTCGFVAMFGLFEGRPGIIEGHERGCHQDAAAEIRAVPWLCPRARRRSSFAVRLPLWGRVATSALLSRLSQKGKERASVLPVVPRKERLVIINSMQSPLEMHAMPPCSSTPSRVKPSALTSRTRFVDAGRGNLRNREAGTSW